MEPDLDTSGGGRSDSRGGGRSDSPHPVAVDAGGNGGPASAGVGALSSAGIGAVASTGAIPSVGSTGAISAGGSVASFFAPIGVTGSLPDGADGQAKVNVQANAETGADISVGAVEPVGPQTPHPKF